MKCIICNDEVKDEFLIKNVYVSVNLPYPKKTSKQISIGKICSLCFHQIERDFQEGKK